MFLDKTVGLIRTDVACYQRIIMSAKIKVSTK